MAKMFIIFLKITIQRELEQRIVSKWDASILCMHDEISAPLKMLTMKILTLLGQDQQTLNATTERQNFCNSSAVQYENILTFKIRNSRQRYVLDCQSQSPE